MKKITDILKNVATLIFTVITIVIVGFIYVAYFAGQIFSAAITLMNGEDSVLWKVNETLVSTCQKMTENLKNSI